MSPVADELIEEAKRLPDVYRLKLYNELSKSVKNSDRVVDQVWGEEIDRLIREVESGKVQDVPWPSVFASVWERIEQRRGY